MIRSGGTPTLEVEPIIAEMRVEEKSESEVADKTLSNEIPPMILPEFAELAPSRGTGSVCTDTTARMAIALKNQWQPSVPVVHALHFQHSAGLLLL